MASDKLARVAWQMGQALLPEHLYAQEESILAEMRMMLQHHGLPFTGIGELKWNESLLREGIVNITKLSLVLPSGQLIDIPGNAKAQPYNMNIAGATQVSVYLHLIQSEEKSGAMAIDMKQDNDEIERIIHRVELSSDHSHSAAINSIKLAQFDKDGEGVWTLSDNYVPPLLQVGSSPFFMKTIQYLTQLVEVFHFKLEREIMASYLSGESLFTAKQCLQGLYKLQHFFSNLNNQVHYHPYYLYEALKFFYIDLCIYQNCTPENVESPYIHDQMAECFKAIFEPLIRQIQEMKGQNPYMPFKLQDSVYVISKLPKEVKDAKEIYLLIQKPTVTTALSLEGFKLAALSRIAMMHQMALQGIPFSKIDRPPFQHSFGAEVDFYLITEGEEWDHALGDRTLAFYDQPGLQGITTYVYWRQG